MEKKTKEVVGKDKKQDPKDTRIKELEEKNNELIDSLQHLQADFENYKKRACKDNEHMSKFASAKLVDKLLSIVDSFELALRDTENNEQFSKGIELIFAQLFSTLESEGLRPIKCIGEKFDPYKHEVMLKGPSDKDEDIVIEEMQKGYMINDKVLRHSKVKVSTGKK
jgi:molecular chaperone GrpE